MKFKKLLSVLLTGSMILSLASCKNTTETSTAEDSEASETTETTEATTVSETEKTETTETSEETTTTEPSESESIYSGMTAEEIVATLTLEQKVAQMFQPAFYNVNKSDMKKNDYGSLLSKFDEIPEPDYEEWNDIVDGYQTAALSSEAAIPYFYGNDSVHGVNFAEGCVIYPHNVNIGAAYDLELTEKMGEYVGSDIMITKMILNFAPCVAAAQDPRWGRTYESYSSDTEIIKELAVAYSKGLLSQGVLVCPKHFICDGYTKYDTGEDPNIMILDRGDAIVTEDQINENLAIYRALIDEGVQVIMISHSALNGTKMHENGEYIWKLKNEMGFEGIILSDWNSIDNCSGDTLKDNIILGVNAGIDMFMEVDSFEACCQYIIEAVEEGTIDEALIDDSVRRIIQVKMDAGLFEDPYIENTHNSYEWNCDESIECARTLAEESFVPLKVDGGVTLEKGSKIFVAGPAADDIGVLCGGWTYTWQGRTDADNGSKIYPEAVTILEALENAAEEYDLTIVTDEAEISSCDAVVLCLGEYPYAEWYGDAVDLSITGDTALDGNKEAIKLAKDSGLPTYTLLIAGRNVIVEEYLADWDTCIMCYLPGSEGGNAIANVLTGKAVPGGHLAMPYYKSEADIDSGNVWLPLGYSALDN